jgi:hypothetical protein
LNYGGSKTRVMTNTEEILFKPSAFAKRAVAGSMLVTGVFLCICISRWSAIPLWINIFILILFLGSLYAFTEVARTRVRLKHAEAEIAAGFRTKRVARNEIESVAWEKGCNATLKLKNGDWVRLPEVGRDTQALANGIRAWLQRQSE